MKFDYLRFPWTSFQRIHNEKFIMHLLETSVTNDQLLQVHALVVKASLFSNKFIMAKLLDSLSSKELRLSRSIFDRIFAPDSFIVNTMMRAHLKSGDPRETLVLFGRMSPSIRDSFSFSLALQACAMLGDGWQGQMVHAHVVKLGFACDLFVQTALLVMYGNLSGFDDAHQVFVEITARDLVVNNAMLALYCRFGRVEFARRLFDGMPIRDLVSWNTMIHGYALAGDVHWLRQLFDRSTHRDVLSWNSMISAYAQKRQPNEALALFHEMQLSGVKPDGITMVSVLSACGDMGALEMGRMVHEYIARNGILLDMKLGTSLIDMYSKSGSIDNALQVFEQMPEKDVHTWSAMIVGLANHGRGQDSLKLFDRMRSEGLKPNDITFVGVLTACSHAGLVLTGRQHFKCMTENFHIVPKIEHYGCIVDLLGRAGLLHEAKELITNMPIQPDSVVWRSLLNACKIHKNVDLAELAMGHLMELEPLADGHYVLLSNIYAQSGRWDKVANIRKFLRNINICTRVPGSSSIEVGNSVHEFVAGDKSHPRSQEIYVMLTEIKVQLHCAGYKPLTYVVSQDIDEYEKERLLELHSEKLAIAFGLLSMPPGSAIRIIKNLRVCDDCHYAIKLISKVYKREIIVRDRNRFHHFSEGLCSCRDYW